MIHQLPGYFYMEFYWRDKKAGKNKYLFMCSLNVSYF